MITVDEMAAFCRRKGFVFPSAEIHENLAGFYDYGPLGIEMKRNIKNLWWKSVVQNKENVVGIDGAIISPESVWKASGHVESFVDIVGYCKKCKKKVKLDKHEIGIAKCPNCGFLYENNGEFNPMFETTVGAVKEESKKVYLRPETAQMIFVNFKNILNTSRVKLPFGIAQIGKAFRNEISPRNFLFRMREFEQMELEFFVHPQKLNDCPNFDEVKNVKINVLTADQQENNDQETIQMTINDLFSNKLIRTKWHAYWIGLRYKWFLDIGINPDKLRLREHTKDELSHYSMETWDIEYNYPFGWKELEGIANRTDFDLKQHIKYSKKDLYYFDTKTNEKIIPYVVAEPSVGVDRIFLTLLFDSYTEEEVNGEKRIVLKLHPLIAPYKVAVFPLVKRDGLDEKAREVFDILKKEFNCFYDENGSLGRRYRRMDEIGTKACVTIDYQTLEDDSVTLRDRDSMKQIRVDIKDLITTIRKFLNGKKLENLGKIIKKE